MVRIAAVGSCAAQRKRVSRVTCDADDDEQIAEKCVGRVGKKATPRLMQGVYAEAKPMTKS